MNKKDEKFFWVIQHGHPYEFERRVFIGTLAELPTACGNINVMPGFKPLQCWDSTFTYRRDMVKEALKSITLYTPPTERTLRATEEALDREMAQDLG